MGVFTVCLKCLRFFLNKVSSSMVQLVKVTKNERPALRCYIVPLCIPQPTLLTVFHLSKHLVENNIKIYMRVVYFFFYTLHHRVAVCLLK